MKHAVSLLILLLPIIVHAGQSNSKPKDLTVKIMVEILKKNASSSGTHETLAYAYNIYNEKTGLGAQHKKPSDDLKYSIPVFVCGGDIKTCRIDFEAIYNPRPRPEQQRIAEDIDTLLEDDPVESSNRTTESISTSIALLNAFNAPITKDNRDFSFNEFKEYETDDPTIIVKAGAYIIQDKQ